MSDAMLMEQTLSKLFGAGGMGLCIKDANRKVLFQNQPCLDACGNQQAEVCKKGCMELFICNDLCPARAEGAQLFSNQRVGDQFMDIVLLNNNEQIISMLYPVNAKHEREIEFFKDKGLSKREMQIVQMVVQGMTNSEIIKDLAISKATLKTHLNNIYKKLPAESRFGFRRRAIQ